MKTLKIKSSRKEEGIIYGDFIFYQYGLAEKLTEKYKPSNRSIDKHMRIESKFSKGVA